MALVTGGSFGRSGGVSQAIAKHIKNINLKPVKKITIKYDPFKEGTKNVRDFNSLILSKKVVYTNPLCLVKTDILSDRLESTILFDLTDGKQFLFKCNNLTTLELFELINKHITPLAPVEATPSIETKSGKGKKKR